MSQTKTEIIPSALSLDIEHREDGHIVLTPESELKLIDLFVSMADGTVMDPKRQLTTDTSFAKQSHAFRQVLLNMATDTLRGVEESTFVDTVYKIAASRKEAEEKRICREKADIELTDFITRLGTNEKFKDLIKSLTDEAPTYQITETVVAAIVPIIEELGWRKDTASDPNL